MCRDGVGWISEGRRSHWVLLDALGLGGGDGEVLLWKELDRLTTGGIGLCVSSSFLVFARHGRLGLTDTVVGFSKRLQAWVAFLFS